MKAGIVTYFNAVWFSILIAVILIVLLSIICLCFIIYRLMQNPYLNKQELLVLNLDLSPEQKVISVKKLRQRYRNIIMVGDGINDAPALVVATVGIAMGAHGTAVSTEVADMVLLVDDITKVSQAVEIGRRTVQIAKQSIYVGLGASFIFMVIASFGLIPPTIGAVLQEIFDVAVILNALRAR